MHLITRSIKSAWPILLGVCIILFAVAHQPKVVVHTKTVYVGPGAKLMNQKPQPSPQSLITQLQNGVNQATCQVKTPVNDGNYSQSDPQVQEGLNDISAATLHLQSAQSELNAGQSSAASADANAGLQNVQAAENTNEADGNDC